MQRKLDTVSEKGFSAKFLKMLGIPVSNRSVMVVRVSIILLCIVGIFLLRADQNNASEYGNFSEVSNEYPELFE